MVPGTPKKLLTSVHRLFKLPDPYFLLYETFKNSSIPVLALYASVILIDTDELTVIKEEPITSYLEPDTNIPTLI